MAAAVEHLQHELAGVRTGRANPGLLENIPVDAHGERVPLKAVGAVLVRNAQTLAVSVYDATVRPRCLGRRGGRGEGGLFVCIQTGAKRLLAVCVRCGAPKKTALPHPSPHQNKPPSPLLKSSSAPSPKRSKTRRSA
jgi:hypothetical protein